MVRILKEGKGDKMSESTQSAAPAAQPAASSAPTQESAAKPTETSAKQEAPAIESLSAEDIALEEKLVSEQEQKAAKPQEKEVSKKDSKKAADKIGAEEVEGSKGELFTLKIDGEEVQMTKEDVVRFAQLGKVGQKRMQEYSQYKKQVDGFLNALKNDPVSVLRDPDLGIDLIKLSQEVLSKKLEEEAMSPEQKELMEAKSELERLREEKKREEEERKQQEYDAEASKFEEELQTKVTEALEKTGLRRDPVVLNRMTDILLMAHDNNLKITPMGAAELVKEELKGDTTSFIKQLSDEQLEEILGDEIITRIRKHSLKKIKSAVPNTKTQEVAKEQPKTQQKSKVNVNSFIKDFYKR
jgi:hypothetical protein